MRFSAARKRNSRYWRGTLCAVSKGDPLPASDPPSFDGRVRCCQCGAVVEPPADLTQFISHCSSCGADTVLPPALIQARQRLYDLAVERERQLEQQRSMQQRILAARKAASRRTTIVVWVLITVLLILPALGVAALFVFGLHFGTQAFESMRDQNRNGFAAISSEIRQKSSQGCREIVHAPEIRIGGAGKFGMQLKVDGSCVHLMGATAVPGAELTLEQLSRIPLSIVPPNPGAVFDYRLCPTVDGAYEFSVHSNQQGPYTIAAIACPRTVAEGLVRSKADDAVTTGLAVVRGWAAELRAKGCELTAGGISVVQGRQLLEIESSQRSTCHQLSLASHFSDVKLTLILKAPNGGTIAEPTPASRVQLEYCPNEAGTHQIEVVPSTRDHFTMASFDCPRRRGP